MVENSLTARQRELWVIKKVKDHFYNPIISFIDGRI